MIEDTTNHCSVTDSVEVFENIIKPDAVLGNDLILKCSDSTITIDGSASSSGVRFKFEWSTPDGKIRVQTPEVRSLQIKPVSIFSFLRISQ